MIFETFETSPSQSHLGRVCCHPSKQRMLSLTLCAVQRPQQTSQITQPRVHDIHTAVPHSSYTFGVQCVIPLSQKQIWARLLLTNMAWLGSELGLVLGPCFRARVSDHVGELVVHKFAPSRWGIPIPANRH